MEDLSMKIVHDLSQRYPRGEKGKLRHYHYHTKGASSGRRLRDPVLNLRHEKLPPMPEHSFLGWRVEDLWELPDYASSLREHLWDHAEKTGQHLTARQITIRSRRASRRISLIKDRMRQDGVPGVYKVSSYSYRGPKLGSYIYCSNKEEARQLASMFLKPHMEEGTHPDVRFVAPGGPDMCLEWSQKSDSESEAEIMKMRKAISDLEQSIEQVQAFHAASKMVSDSISANLAAESLEEMAND